MKVWKVLSLPWFSMKVATALMLCCVFGMLRTCLSQIF